MGAIMIIKFAAGFDENQISILATEATRFGLQLRTVRYPDGSLDCGISGSGNPFGPDSLHGATVLEHHQACMFASSEHRQRTVVQVGAALFGAGRPVAIAGPCVVESETQLVEAARAVKAAGADILRGGAFKPRTSPYSFQGHGETALKMLLAARDATGLPVVTEVLEAEQTELVAEYADMLQVGARNMANTPLLKRVGRTGKPVLLKRGFAATIDEWLMSAEYILAEGNPNVVLCERGIRGFDPAFRFNLDLNAVPMVKQLTHLPVVVDPSHGTGIRSLVHPMALAGIAAGADGLIIESQPEPDSALCDGYQTIDPAELASILAKALQIWSLLSPELTQANALQESVLVA